MKRKDKIQNALKQSTRYFETYEEREQAFRESVFSLIPRKYLGPKVFWKDFGRISRDGFSQLKGNPIAYISSNPRDCLAFGTPGQVLSAAQMCAQQTDKAISVSTKTIAEAFGIQENLYQPVRTLSGGETVKLAIAKTFITAAYSTRLTIASPFSWLSHDNVHYFRKLFDHYNELGIPVDLLALEGEDSAEPIESGEGPDSGSDEALDFTIFLKDIHIRFGTSFNSAHSRETLIQLDDLTTDLSSPCLFVGKNGQGKSLIAKVLAGAIPYKGIARVGTDENTGPARLLFQDVITQTLLRSFNSLAALSCLNNASEAMCIFEKILAEYSKLYKKANLKESTFGDGENTGSHTLLEIKAILVATRLLEKRYALILDEPDWGLTREASIALVFAIIQVAHDLGVPVILISHKPWWRSIAKSIIHIEKSPVITNNKNGDRFFQIRLRRNGKPQP